MNVETILTARIGGRANACTPPAAAMIQVALDFRLYLRRQIGRLWSSCCISRRCCCE